MGKEDIVAALQGFFTERTGAPFEINEHYMTSGRFDSFDVVNLLAFVEERFDIQLSSDDFQHPDFYHVAGLARLIEAKTRHV